MLSLFRQFLIGPYLSRNWRGITVVLLALGLVLVLSQGATGVAPLTDWLIWVYVRIWFAQAFLCAGCVSFGRWLLQKGFGIHLPSLEQWVMSMALGIVAFVTFMYVGGALRLYGRTFAVVLPAFMLAVGSGETKTALRVWLRRRQSEPSAASWLSQAIRGFGLFAAILLYLQCATPDSLLYDATWSHLTVAEDYAREGGIVPFIASTPKNLPHLSSIIYTWNFLLPGMSQPAQRWMNAQHSELLLFVWTVVATGAALRWMLPKKHISGAWPAYFLFPGFYVSDANFGATADHVAAFFAIPFFLASVRASRKFSPKFCVLAGVFAGALLHTKYQCMYLVAPVAGLFIVRWIWLLWLNSQGEFPGFRAKKGGRRLWLAPLLFIGATLVSFGPHLLKNWVFYHNPFYPMLLQTFSGSTPVFADFPYDRMTQATATGDWLTQVRTSLGMLFTFSFKPPRPFTGYIPTFGSLFTLLTPIILMHWRKRRVWLGLVLAYAGLFMWAMIFRVERNLQLLLPWLVAVTAAAIVLGWRSGKLARFGVAVFVLLQVSWGSQFMIAGGESRIRSFVSLVKSDQGENSTNYFDLYRANFRKVGAALPKDAVLLLHTGNLHLGMDRRTLSGWAGWQYVIDYRTMKNPRDVYLRYRQLGITHMAWNNYDFPTLKQEDVLFFALTHRFAKRVPGTANFLVWEMPAEAPPVEPTYQVASLGLYGYKDGLYDIDQLNIFEDLPHELDEYPEPIKRFTGHLGVEASLKSADAVLKAKEYKLPSKIQSAMNGCFRVIHNYYRGYGVSGYSVYLRKKDVMGCRRVDKL